MTVETTDNRISHVGDGSTIQFAFPFGIFGTDDIVVYLATAGGSKVLQQRGVDYDVTLTNPDDLPSPGVITFCQLPAPVPPTPQQTVKIVRTLPYTQEIEITNGGPMPAASLNEAFDRAVILMQQLQDQLRQATMSLGEIVASDFFKLLAVSGNATAARALLQAQQLNNNLTALSGLSGAANLLPYFTGTGTMTTTPLSSFARGLLDDQSPAAARTTLQVDNSGGVTWKQLASGTDFQTTCPTASTITMSSDQTANIKFGTLIKVKISGGYYVGQCVTCTAVLLTVSGVALSTGSNALQELYYTSFSDMERDIQQVTKRYYAADGSGVDTVTATLDPPPPALVDKMHCRIVAAGKNTGAMTFEPNALGRKDIVKLNNVPMAEGDIPGQYFVMDLQYSSALDKWVILNAGVPNGVISQSKLKTSSETAGTLSIISGGTVESSYTLPGGEYGFMPSFRCWTNESGRWPVNLYSGLLQDYDGYTLGNTNKNVIYMKFTGGTIAGTSWFQCNQRYVTSSGEVPWFFALRDKTTKFVKAAVFSLDHPCFGNGGKPALVPHPFQTPKDDEEIIVVHPTPEQIAAAEDYSVRGDDEADYSVLRSLLELYDIDEDSKPSWPDVPVTVGITKVLSPQGRMVKANADNLKAVPENTPIEVIKKVIPQTEGLICRAFKAKETKTAKEDAVHG